MSLDQRSGLQTGSYSGTAAPPEDIVGTARRIVDAADPDSTLPRCELQAVHLGFHSWDLVTDTVSHLLGERTGSNGRPIVALVMDRTPIKRDGEEIKPAIAAALARRFELREVVLDDGHPELHASEPVIDEASAAVRGADALVSIGGGTITDIGKVASESAGHIPNVVVQTAASVDGFTDDVSVLLKQGVKRTTPSRWPDVVIADVTTIDQAPTAMNIAGFGELMSTFVAPADWLLASLVGTDTSFHPGPIAILEVVGADFADWSDQLGSSIEATGKLARALGIRGIATGVSGGTACLSGVEHLTSHMLDLSNGAAHRPIGLHGAQVGAASVVAACAWQLLFDRLETADRSELSTQLTDRPLTADEQTVRDAFAAIDPSGQIGGECWADYGKKAAAVDRLRDNVRSVVERWAEHAPRLRALVRPPAELAHSLVAAGAAARLTDLPAVTGPDQAVWAITNCAYMRNRFTAVDLLIALGWWRRPDIDEVLQRAEHEVEEAETSHAPR